MSAAVILAAGGSSRMGRPKQLLPLDGRPLLTHAIVAARTAGCHPVVVVLGRDADACVAAIEAAGLAQGVRTVRNAEWERGPGTSLRKGIHTARHTGPVESLYLMLGDQPRVTGRTLDRLRHSRTDAGVPVAVAAYAGTAGPPVLVSGSYLDRLSNWPDDQGAKTLWSQCPSDVVRVPCPEAAIDVDTPVDYETVLRSFTNPRS